MTPLEQLLRYTAARPNGCIEWTGATDQDGYAIVQIDGRSRRAHRIAWEIANGSELPSEILVRHKCDNPPCICPSHLLTGTHLDNVRDCIERGRRSDRRGENCPTAKLDWLRVREIRRLVGEGEPHERVAQKFEVSRRLVGMIVNRLRWADDPADQSILVSQQPTKGEQ